MRESVCVVRLNQAWHVIRTSFEYVNSQLVEHVTLETHDQPPADVRDAVARARAG